MEVNPEPAPDRPLAFVTGATGGLGSAICRRLASQGYRLALHSRSEPPVALLAELGEHVVHRVRADLSDNEAVLAAVEDAVLVAGQVHVAVHAAGPHVPMTHLSTVSPSDFARQVSNDVNAFFNVMHALLPTLRQTRGSMTAVTTAATSRYPKRDGLSAAPKAAVEALARAFASEEGRYGVRVNCVGPGMLTDGMAERLMASGDLDQKALDAARRNIPLNHFGSASDIAEAVAFLASPQARYITGQKLDVDGGFGL